MLESVFELLYMCVCVWQLQWPGSGYKQEISGTRGGTLVAACMLMFEDCGQDLTYKHLISKE